MGFMASRLVRDVSRQLNKQVRLVTKGEQTGVDRYLDKLEAPLSHLVRNALDHGWNRRMIAFATENQRVEQSQSMQDIEQEALPLASRMTDGELIPSP